MEIKNAKITSTTLGKEDHGILTFFVDLEFDGGGVGFGGYSLDNYNASLNKIVCTVNGLEAINRILDVVGVDKWEDLPGKYIRIKSNGWGSTIKEIGNIIKGKWFNIEDFFEEQEANKLMEAIMEDK